MKDKQLLIYEGIREKIYQSFAACYSLPNAETIETAAKLEDALRNVCVKAADAVAAMKEEAAPIEALKIDYSRLFLGPFKVLAPPYGSIYLDNARTVMGPSTADVRNRYKEFGLDVSQSFKDAPDHIAAELEFIYYLIFRQLEALKQADYETARLLLNAQKSFIADHLGAWISQFTDNISKNAETDFYKNLGLATVIFIRCDFNYISEVSLANLMDAAAASDQV